MEDKKLKEDLEFDAMEDLKSEVYNALSEIYAKYELKGATLKEFDSAVDFATIHMKDEFGESLKEGADEVEYSEDDYPYDGVHLKFKKDFNTLSNAKENFDSVEDAIAYGKAHPDFEPDCVFVTYKDEDKIVHVFESLNEDAKDTEVEAEVEVTKEDAKEPKLETFEDKMNFLVDDEDEAIAGYDKIIAMLDEEEDANAIAQLNHIKEEEVAHKDFLEVLKGDKEAVYEHDDEEKKDEIDVDAEMEVVDIDDVDDDFGVGESLEEDTVKKGNKWVNKGKEGTHGEFKTKKEADAQRKAMFANGYREEVEEDIDDDFDSGNFIAEEAEEFGVTVNWNDMEDGVDEEDAKTFKKVIKNTDDKILDKHFGKDTPERKLVGAIKDMDEEAHETGHIKAKKPIELRARR